MRAGSRNQLITIQQQVTKENAHGQIIVESWEDIAKPWANVRNQNGKEYIQNSIELSQVSTSFRILYRDGITNLMRVLYRGEVYDIKAVLPDDQSRKHMDLVCQKGSADNG